MKEGRVTRERLFGAKITTRLGIFQVWVGPDGIVRLALPGEEVTVDTNSTPPPAESAVIREVSRQIAAYMEGKRKAFELPLDPRGTDFERNVWREVALVPHGEVRTYGDIARSIGKPGASRAVGAANGRNPLPLFIPCHRIIGSGGRLTGYGGGLALKASLLSLEGAQLSSPEVRANTRVVS